MIARTGICRVTFILSEGARISIDAENGQTIMTAARRAGVEGIEGKRRGNCSCVTCHVYIADAWAALIDPPSAMEESMLDFAEDVTARSRLGCQIAVTAALDGLEVHIPDQQRVLGC